MPPPKHSSPKSTKPWRKPERRRACNVYEPYCERVEQQHAAFQRLVDLPVPPPKPVGRLRFTGDGVEFLVRYPAEMKQSAATDDGVVSALREAIEHEPRLTLAGSGAPKLQSTI